MTSIFNANSNGIYMFSPRAGACFTMRPANSTHTAFYPPQVTTTERDAVPAYEAGAVIYNSTVGSLQKYNGASWENIGLTDGNFGDVTVGSAGTAMTINTQSVNYSKIQNISASSRLLGRGEGGGAGVTQEITLGAGLNISGTSLSATAVGLSDSNYGDVTVSGSGTAMAVNSQAITYAKIQNASAASRLIGRGSSGGAGSLQELTVGSGLSLAGTVLDVAPTTPLTQLVLGNFPSGGSIGSASGTIDSHNCIVFQQTTLLQSVSIPNPTVTSDIKLCYFVNKGSVSLTVLGAALGAGRSCFAIWDGSDWNRSQ